MRTRQNSNCSRESSSEDCGLTDTAMMTAIRRRYMQQQTQFSNGAPTVSSNRKQRGSGTESHNAARFQMYLTLVKTTMEDAKQMLPPDHYWALRDIVGRIQ